MASDLKLPDYTIDYRPTVISINNFDQLKTAVEAYAAKYQNLAVSTSTEKEAKASRAELRKLKAALDDRRKEIKKDYAKPYKEFESKVKSLEQTLQSAIDPIDSALKDLQERERYARQQDVKKLINEMAVTYKVDPEEVEIDPTWLNKSTSHSKIVNELADGMKTIAKQHQQLETDIQTITALCQAQSLDPSGWVDQLKQGQDVSYLLTAISKTADKKKEQKKLAEAKAAEARTHQIDRGDSIVDKNTGEVVSKSVVLKITGTIDQMQLLHDFMEEHGIKFERVMS
ncbi:DUF1351 domain-containing protein [Lentilactobacillus hilgardii]|uniref:DUF1351 domain-containing protein n=1 Tax=Lentilactobacillus hilgardii TaxID=1588 RepID=UPI0021A2C4F0|nr:DUF1351 domain-containing protein [Lentilactobacillus hilgardii]MCT3390349.1 DUF1351 domain-containing protein [Lentilactobacillus hilgardii]